MLTADKVLVTIGTPCSMSAVGSTETYNARVAGAPEFIAFAAFDAGLVDLALQPGGELQISWRAGVHAGEPATIAQIEQLHGAALRRNLGIRYIDELTALGDSVVTDIVASLPHDFESGGLRYVRPAKWRNPSDSKSCGRLATMSVTTESPNAVSSSM